MTVGLGLGRLFNIVASASGVHIPLTNVGAISFVSYLDAGTQSFTVRESISGASERLLPVVDRLYKGPGVGGTWTEILRAPSATFDLTTDAVNDCVVFTVLPEQLGDGFDCVEVTAASGTLLAITHDLKVQRAPQLLAKSVV